MRLSELLNQIAFAFFSMLNENQIHDSMIHCPLIDHRAHARTHGARGIMCAGQS
jgi:hypothetical protein